MPKHSNCTPPSAIAAYQPPDPRMLAARLLRIDSTPSWTIDTRESTPFVAPSPPSIECLKLSATKSKKSLERLIGENATEEIRQLIRDPCYWRIEANHYAQALKLINHAELGQRDVLCCKQAAAVRETIPTPEYWEIEAIHNSRHYGIRYSHIKLPKLNPSQNSRHFTRHSEKLLTGKSASYVSKSAPPKPAGPRRSERIRSKTQEIKSQNSG